MNIPSRIPKAHERQADPLPPRNRKYLIPALVIIAAAIIYFATK